MSEDIVKKRGRPTKGGRKRSSNIHARTTDDIMNMLDFLCEKKHKNKTRTIEELIRTSYNLTIRNIKIDE